MSEMIKDGTGRGYLVRVNSDNRLSTAATIVPLIAEVSMDEKLAFISAVVENQIASGTDHSLFWFKNTDPLRHVHVSRAAISWNGGDTNHNRTIKFRVRGGASTPSGGYNPYSPVNLNVGSEIPATVDVRVWDQVTVGGMVMANTGSIAFSSHIGPGTTLLSFDDALILGTNESISVSVLASEPGEFSLWASGYYHTPLET